MRKHSLGTDRRTALAALLLVAACDQTPTDGSTIDMSEAIDMATSSGLQLPDCQAGQLITVGANGTVSCISVAASFMPPSCPMGYVLNAVAGQVSCVPQGTGTTDTVLRTAINQAVTATAQLQNAVARASSPSRRYVGRTPAAVSGRISSAGTVGLPAASLQCAAAFGPGSVMCTVYDLYSSVATGVIKPTDTIAKSWVYMASWQSFGTTTEPTAGLSDNCGGYTSDGMISGWYGAAIKWEVASTGIPALKVYTGPTGANEGAPCGTPLPIACCK